jgi:type IV pilus assembly protein PilE
MKSSTGFSLIELMIVVVIVGILMAISLPAYQGYVQRSHRADGHSSLLDIAARQERYVAQNNKYTKTIGGAGGLNLGDANSRDGYYTLAVDKCATGGIAICYLITATAVGSQASDTDCKTITYDSAGTKGGTTAECW